MVPCKRIANVKYNINYNGTFLTFLFFELVIIYNHFLIMTFICLTFSTSGINNMDGRGHRIGANISLHCCISGSKTHPFRSEKASAKPRRKQTRTVELRRLFRTPRCNKQSGLVWSGPVRFGSGAGGLTANMVKCVVSGCPNRVSSVNDNRGIFNRPPKRFFNFPTDPARIKVRGHESNGNRALISPELTAC